MYLHIYIHMHQFKKRGIIKKEEKEEVPTRQSGNLTLKKKVKPFIICMCTPSSHMCTIYGTHTHKLASYTAQGLPETLRET